MKLFVHFGENEPKLKNMLHKRDPKPINISLTHILYWAISNPFSSFVLAKKS